eukprot:255197-Chlamydomonas_euryale.AAC.1
MSRECRSRSRARRCACEGCVCAEKRLWERCGFVCVLPCIDPWPEIQAAAAEPALGQAGLAGRY